MSTSITQAFIKEFQSGTHAAYQRQGSKLRNTVRNTTNVTGSSTVFQKVGKGTASTKARHGLVPVMNNDHSSVECFLYDYYAGDYVDKLDKIKTNIDEMQVVQNAGAYALGRKTDDLILTAAASATQQAQDGTTGLTKDKVLAGFDLLNSADVPDDGDRYAVVGSKQWLDLMTIDAFSNALYIGEDSADMPWVKGVTAKKWLGFTWIMHTGLTVASNIRSCLMYHKSAIGHASGAEVTTDITWEGPRAAHFINNMMSQGAVLIDNYGVVKLPCLES